MTTYDPDSWTLLRISHPEHGGNVRVLDVWDEASKNVWKLSSRGTHISDADAEVIEIDTASGSVFLARASAHGMSLYAQEVLAELRRDNPELSFERIAVNDVVRELGTPAFRSGITASLLTMPWQTGSAKPATVPTSPRWVGCCNWPTTYCWTHPTGWAGRTPASAAQRHRLFARRKQGAGAWSKFSWPRDTRPRHDDAL